MTFGMLRPASRRLALATLLGLGFLAPANGAAESSGWTVSQISGEVDGATAGGAKVALAAQQSVEAGSTVGTGANGRLTLTRGETTVVLESNSRMEIPVNGDAGSKSRIIQSGGTLLFTVEKRSTPHFEVQTPYLAAVVKGTSFAVSVDGSGADVRVSTGAVEVRAIRSGEVTLVRPGLTARVSAAPGSRLSITPSRDAPSPAGAPHEGRHETGGAQPFAKSEHMANGSGNGEARGSSSAGSKGRALGQSEEKRAAMALHRTIGQTSIDITQASHGFLGDGRRSVPTQSYGRGSANGTGRDLAGGSGMGNGNAGGAGQGYGNSGGHGHGIGNGHGIAHVIGGGGNGHRGDNGAANGNGGGNGAANGNGHGG